MSRDDRTLAVYAHPAVIEALEPYAERVRLFPSCRASCTVWYQRRSVSVSVGGASKVITRWETVDGVQHELPPMLGTPCGPDDVQRVVDAVLTRINKENQR